MRHSPRPLFWKPIGATFFVAALRAILASFASAQSAPTNSAPNPYQTVTGWFHVPAGRAWGSSAFTLATTGLVDPGLRGACSATMGRVP